MRWLLRCLAYTVWQARARNVHFYTYSDTIPHPGLCALAEAAYELGHGLRVMGLSKRPGYILIHNHSPTLKFLMLQEVLEYEVSKGRIHEDDIVIFSDGHDVLLQQSLAEIFVAYSRFPDWPHTHPSHGTWDLNDQIPFANQSWTINRWIRFLPEDFCRMIRGDGPYPYPNIGLSMAPAKRFIEVLKRNNKIVLEEEMNDQGAMWLVIFRYAEELNIQIDQHAEVFLNMLEYKAGDLEREPCDKTWFRGAGGFGRPPRNALTNTTPGILHFNGPSHEDGVWPSCYHVINGKFRRKEHGHAFYDIDHDILVGTDNICDYSWYDIHSFHAHPLNHYQVDFLEGFYKLPVDPGLLAWRGDASAVDKTNFGSEADLQRKSPRLHKALQ
ncbi:unnamed protein product [Cladocopium goreaui]|uniref:Uncharacterized protein n=1 Tax=Cladocopium goreaui TaxID=2562237 RepID=A0A9P1GJQ1_9DINO|nr:unnamed protein product [Cladocopium goreaui]